MIQYLVRTSTGVTLGPRKTTGWHILANLVVCCARCNQIKGQLTEGEFRALLGLLAHMAPTRPRT